MRKLHGSAAALAAAEGAAAYRFCLLLTGSPHRAEQAAFQGFLYLAGEEKELAPGEDRRQLYRHLYRAAEDAWYRRGSGPLKRAAFAELTGAAPGDRLWRLMKRPLRRRAAVYLVLCARFSPEDAAQTLRLRRERVEAWLAAEDGAEALRGELDAPGPRGAWAEQLGDELLLRWQERNVPLENALLRFRSAADRLVPFLALAAALFCAAAVWYAGRVG